jgi:uncharacterized protein YfaS (alpha-2-macroglobulin family)
MVLDYMKQAGQISPELQMQAEEFVAQGYQRLLSFEVPGGGFSLFGRAPADPLLSAYGLMMLSDMGRVYPVDRDAVNRTAYWLMGQQQPDGSWTASGWREAAGLSATEDRLATTAFVIWALAEAGYNGEPRWSGVDFLLRHHDEVEDPYVLALCANALSVAEPDHFFTNSALDALAQQALVEGDAVHWQTGLRTFMGGGGRAGSLEVTALAAQAMLRSGRHPDLAQGALTYLIQQKDSFGTWQTTQATVWALQALMLSATQEDASAGVEVVASVNGGEADPIVLDEGNAGVVHILAFDDVGSGENRVAFQMTGDGRLMYQITSEYYLPWDQVPVEPEEQEPLTVKVSYDRTTLAVQDEVTAHVWVNLNAPGMAQMVLLDLGLPPGFTVLDEDLRALVAQGLIERFELTGRQIIVYLTDLRQNTPLSFQYRLRASYPLRVQVPASQAYDYYSPDRRGEQRPLVVVVDEEIRE